MKIPVIDFAECTECDACIDICPTVFRKNDAGLMEVIDLSDYPEDDVDECIKNCPCDCIYWDEVQDGAEEVCS